MRCRIQRDGQFVRAIECENVEKFRSALRNCQEQVLHIAGHMGPEGLELGDAPLAAVALATDLRASDVRLVVLNGCEGGRPKSPLASAYLTLADRLVRDAHIPEVVAHRLEITEDDADAFGKAFHRAFFSASEGFEPARSALQGRKAGSEMLRYSPVVISQREPIGS